MSMQFLFAGLVTAVTFSGPISSGSPVTAVTSASGTIYIGDGIAYNQSSSTGNLVQLNPTTFTSTGVVDTTSFSAESTYGNLHAGSSSSFDITGSPAAAAALAIGYFEDVITVDYSPLNGQAGLLYVDYTLDGTISSSGTGDGFANVLVEAGDANSAAVSYVQIQRYTSSASGLFGLPAISFTYGKPFFLFFGLYTGSGTEKNGAPDGIYGPAIGNGRGSGTALFFNTLTLTGLDPTDLNGDPATGATFSSQSGTPYSIDGVVPEPSTVILLGPALATLLGISRRRVWL